MPEMQNRHGETAILDAHSTANQANSKVRILIAPTGKCGIKSIYHQIIFAPNTDIATTQQFPTIFSFLAPLWQIKPQPTQKIVDIIPQPMSKPGKSRPIGYRTAFTGNVAQGKSFGHQYPIAGDHPAAFGKLGVLKQEVRLWDTIPVQEYQIITPRLQRRPVPNLRQSESQVLMPNMLEPIMENLLMGLHHRLGCRTGAIVGNNDFPITGKHARLVVKTRQYCIKRIRPIIGTDQNCYFHSSNQPYEFRQQMPWKPAVAEIALWRTRTHQTFPLLLSSKAWAYFR